MHLHFLPLYKVKPKHSSMAAVIYENDMTWSLIPVEVSASDVDWTSDAYHTHNLEKL